MDVVEFIEEVLDTKLLSYQKDFVYKLYLAKQTETPVNIVFPRGRTCENALMLMLAVEVLCKEINNRC